MELAVDRNMHTESRLYTSSVNLRLKCQSLTVVLPLLICKQNFSVCFYMQERLQVFNSFSPLIF